MIRSKWQFSINSLPVKLILSVMLMTLPLVGMLIYNNFYAIHVVRGQVADSYSNSLTLYMNQIDEGLNDVDAYMNTIAFGNDLLSVGQAQTDDDYYSAKYYLHNKLVNDIPLYRSVNSFFVYEYDRQDYMDVARTGDLTYEETEKVQQFIVELIKRQEIVPFSSMKRWQYYKIGDHYYIIDVVQKGDAYLGAWIKTDQLLFPLQSLKMGKGGEILFANDKGEPITETAKVRDNGVDLSQTMKPYYITGSDKKFLIVGASSIRGDFSLITIIPDSSILANLPYLQRIIWLVTCGSIFVIFLGLFFMRRAILIPLNRILQAMKKVRGGDWSTQVNMNDTSNEFHLLGDSFNAMMTEIQTLRVNVFEEQLNKQKEELQRLQLQVNPHFFLNSLNIVYNLAKVKNYALILEMTESLIFYFRYLFRNIASFVKIQEELDHTRNYLNIQRLRFPGQLSWAIEIPDYLYETPVPPLIIQSFVENSIKHAVTMDEPVIISIKINLDEQSDGTRIRIRIMDTGCGFNEQVLLELQAGRNIQNEQGEHTGIWNVARRLKLLYEDEATIQFSNDLASGGAVVEMITPIRPKLTDM